MLRHLQHEITFIVNTKRFYQVDVNGICYTTTHLKKSFMQVVYGMWMLGC